ncbi:hypothetical protein BIW11_02215 [Tropilaelaps mercedesae]|uniref:Protein kinase domain-containing protein n=1 Tax=Tropilaelaps mercedesae TaxID=418985 RepID=A0A1V9X1D4_9ACAR|nr:hypothetical protein BIW11_02215 [Tropilaelaps mercedesae]
MGRSKRSRKTPKMSPEELKELKFTRWDEFEHLAHVLRDDICGKVMKPYTGKQAAIAPFTSEDKIEYIIFESQPTGTFADFLKSTPPSKDERLGKFYTAQVASALDFLLDQDIAHRNILLDSLPL